MTSEPRGGLRPVRGAGEDPQHDDEDAPEARPPGKDPRLLPFFFEGLDLSSAFPLALTRRVIRRGLRTTRSGRLELAGRVLLLLAVSTISAILLGPRLVAADLPTDAVFVGTPARSRVVADRDYEIVDQAETDSRRTEAARLSRSVWDLDHARQRVEIRLLRTQLGRLSAWLSARRPEPSPSEPLPIEVPVDLAAGADTLRSAIAGELELGATLAPPDEAWRALLLAAWRDPAATETVVSAVDDALGREIVGERLLLERDEARGIVVREIGVEPVAERTVDDVAAIPDLPTRQAALQTELAATLASAPITLPPDDAEALARWGASLLRTTLTYNAAETERRRRLAQSDVAAAVIRIRRGETVLGAGEVMTDRHLLILKAMETQQGRAMQTRAELGTGGFVLLLCLVVYLFGARGVFRRYISTRDLLFVASVLVLFLFGLVAAEWGIVPLLGELPDVPRSVLLYAIPVSWAAMQVRVVLSADIAFLLALVAALLGGVTTEPGMAWTVTAILSSLAGTAGVRRVRSRWQLLLAGAAAGIVGAGAAITLEVFRGTLQGPALLYLGVATLASGLLSGALVAAATPLVEATFGYVTDLRLLALADLNQPLLKELIVRAPGTWHHSMRVARLAEAAATAIGAHALLTRVMSLYHDVGKLREPLYFSENQTTDNPHDRLPPEESAAYLRRHVELGRELAARHRIPRAVAAVIEEHHGDNLMETFFRKAVASTADPQGEELAPSVDEATYRYGGRLPRSKESALVMLADQIEAASRDLDDVSEALIVQVTDHFVNRAIIGGSLAECDLSMRELEVGRDAFREALADLLLRPSTDTDALGEGPRPRPARARPR